MKEQSYDFSSNKPIRASKTDDRDLGTMLIDFKYYEKKGNINNSKKIIDEIYFDKFDIIIDLNINFSFEISMIINELRSKYKVVFVSNHSDYFYNIQLQTNKNNPSYNSVEYLLGKI